MRNILRALLASVGFAKKEPTAPAKEATIAPAEPFRSVFNVNADFFTNRWGAPKKETKSYELVIRQWMIDDTLVQIEFRDGNPLKIMFVKTTSLNNDQLAAALYFVASD